MRVAWSCIVILVAVLGTTTSAHAFSDPALFAAPVADGGGGGRYFTGARADGYACSVCHRGGAAPHVVIDPLPERLESGTRYELTVRWDEPAIPQAFQLELVTPSGIQPAVQITPAAMLPAESRCDSRSDGAAAVYSFDVGRRRVVGVEGCGASMVTLSFLASGEPIELSIAGVKSDGSATVEGDGVFEQRITLGNHLTASGGGGCSTVPGDGTSGWLIVAVIAAAWMARRRYGISRPASTVSSRAQTWSSPTNAR